MKEQRYVLSVENTTSKRMYFKRSDGYGGSIMTTADPHLAMQWEITADKTEILKYIEKIKKAYASLSQPVDAKPNSIRIEIFEWETNPISGTDENWITALQRHALTKMTLQEVEALGVTNLEIFRRLGN